MARYTHVIQVADDDIDGNAHVNNVAYVRWMQEAATAHSDAVGCTAATIADGASWFVRCHHIEYVKPAVAGDQIRVETWIDHSGRATSTRKYEICHNSGTILAKGETEWVYVDALSGRPKSIPAEILELFTTGN